MHQQRLSVKERRNRVDTSDSCCDVERQFSCCEGGGGVSCML